MSKDACLPNQTACSCGSLGLTYPPYQPAPPLMLICYPPPYRVGGPKEEPPPRPPPRRLRRADWPRVISGSAPRRED
jgi:hypothetical protein